MLPQTAEAESTEGELQTQPPEEAAPQFNPDEVKKEVEGIELAKGDVPDSEDRRTLHRYMRRRMLYSTELTRIKDQMKAMVNELTNRINGLDFVFHPLVEPIVRKMLEGQKRTKSVKTPYGTAGFRSQGEKLVVTDPQALIASTENEGMEKLAAPVWQPVMDEIEAYFKNTGEVPPGVEHRPAQENFYAK